MSWEERVEQEESSHIDVPSRARPSSSSYYTSLMSRIFSSASSPSFAISSYSHAQVLVLLPLSESTRGKKGPTDRSFLSFLPECHFGANNFASPHSGSSCNFPHGCKFSQTFAFFSPEKKGFDHSSTSGVNGLLAYGCRCTAAGGSECHFLFLFRPSRLWVWKKPWHRSYRKRKHCSRKVTFSLQAWRQVTPLPVKKARSLGRPCA